jgi:hypothetical protein
MEEISTQSAATAVICDACYKQVNNDDSFCDSCGYPLKGTEKEQNYFKAKRNCKEIDLESANKKIEIAGKTMYWIAGLTFVAGIVFYFINKDSALLIVNIILTGIYLALGVWSKSKPLAAIISGFSLYILMIIINGVVNPLTIANGIIVKIFIIGYFIKGLKSAIEAEKLKNELNIE